jgi:16S rRNA (guanine966-N2)-methyltransferase
MLRIIGGRHKGRMLDVPYGKSTRPTKNRVREALFNIIESKYTIAGAQVLDACAGSGALGLEAISRGAHHSTFFDINKYALEIIKKNIASLKEEESTEIYQVDVTNPPKPKNGVSCSFVFLDAPYQSKILLDGIMAISRSGWLRKSSIVIIETEKDANFIWPTFFKEIELRIYGSTKLHFVEYFG